MTVHGGLPNHAGAPLRRWLSGVILIPWEQSTTLSLANTAATALFPGPPDLAKAAQGLLRDLLLGATALGGARLEADM